MTKAIIHNDGRVVWNPPAVFQTSCQMDVQFFPFDIQRCFMKFGSWSYDGFKVDIRHVGERNNTNIVPVGIDLSEFQLSVEWDIMDVPAMRRENYYACCDYPYVDVLFNITLRRKTLFYTVNLIIPTVGISCLSVLVFYLPSDSGEKVSLTTSILLSLTLFLLVLIEIIPSTSLALSLLGKYLVFTLSLVTLSVVVTVAVLNVHFRSPSTHPMSPWIKKLFIRIFPKLLLMRAPQYRIDSADSPQQHSHKEGIDSWVASSQQIHGFPMNKELCKATRRSGGVAVGPTSGEELIIHDLDTSPGGFERETTGPGPTCYPREIDKAINDAMFIAQHIDNKDEFESRKEDWKYVAMVLDRLFLWLFTSTCLFGSVAIFLQIPSLYDNDEPIDIHLSQFAKEKEYLNEIIPI